MMKVHNFYKTYQRLSKMRKKSSFLQKETDQISQSENLWMKMQWKVPCRGWTKVPSKSIPIQQLFFNTFPIITNCFYQKLTKCIGLLIQIRLIMEVTTSGWLKLYPKSFLILTFLPIFKLIFSRMGVFPE